MRNGSERPLVCSGRTYKRRSGCGNVYLTVNRTDDGDGDPLEVFCTMGKTGLCQAAWGEALARMINYVLNLGGDLGAVAQSLQGIKCQEPLWDEGQQIHSCPDLIGRVLEYAGEEHQRLHPEIIVREPSVERATTGAVPAA